MIISQHSQNDTYNYNHRNYNPVENRDILKMRKKSRGK